MINSNYSKEPARVMLIIDVKSFYCSVKCIEHGADPLNTLAVIMSPQVTPVMIFTDRAHTFFNLCNS